jgi:glycosyltransferase involved in cell wall biosynthesis
MSITEDQKFQKNSELSPLVTVICLCYNQAKFVAAALESVAKQNYENIELIIVDDASQDQSVAAIKQWLAHTKKQFANEIIFLPLTNNVGNCKAFNLGFAKAKGAYLIDLAADDILLPENISTQVAKFQTLSKNCGVLFSNALYIDENSNALHLHHKQSADMAKYLQPCNVYTEILAHSFICTPTMMIRKEVLDNLQGYDEQLCYEDFDFWVRSAQNYAYCYTDAVLVQKRKVKKSLGTKFYSKEAKPFLLDTYKICEKASKQQNQNQAQNQTQNQALALRIRYHIRLCCYTGNEDLVANYQSLLFSIAKPKLVDKFWSLLATYQIKLLKFYQLYLISRQYFGT